MAFATSNVRRASSGNLNKVVGGWTGSEGDAAGTVTVKGGQLLKADFWNFDNTSGEDRPTPVSISESGGTITISVFNHVNVALGRFEIEWA